VFITVAPAQGNKTSVQYSPLYLTTDQGEVPPVDEPVPTTEPTAEAEKLVEPVAAEMPDIPIPTDAQDVNYEAEFGEITFTSPAQIKDLVKFYRQELRKKDWVEDEVVALVEDTVGLLEFSKDEATLSLFLLHPTAETEVTISGSGLAVPADTSTETTPELGSELSPVEPEELVAEDKDGLPVPSNYENFMDESTPFRRFINTNSPAPVKALAEFYSRELSTWGWTALPSTVSATDTEATQLFENPDGRLELRLTKNAAAGTDISLLVKLEAAAKKAGVLPLSGQARLYFGNINEGPVTYTLNQQDIIVEPQDLSQESMEGVPSLDLPPGKYEFTLTIPGQAAMNDTIEVGADEAWGLIAGPGGAFPAQLY
jgi:hypothetical protein